MIPLHNFKQIQMATSGLPFIEMIEPTYDANRLLKDYAYRYSMVDKFTAYMNDIKPYADRVKYFMKMCEAMGLPLYTQKYGTANSRIQDRPGTYAGHDTFVDEQGNKIPVLFTYWQMPDYISDQERAILHQIYFEGFYFNSSETYLGVEVKRFNNLKDNYFDKIAKHTNVNGFRQSELNTTQRQIDHYQELINNWSKSYPHLTDRALLKQLVEISKLVEDEINGSSAIHWELFTRPDYLKPLALLWDMVAYKLFLIEQIHDPQPASTEKPKRVNTKAQDLHNRVILKFKKYIKTNYSHPSAIQALTHDFKSEYGKGTPEHTKKRIEDIIRKYNQNNKE